MPSISLARLGQNPAKCEVLVDDDVYDIIRRKGFDLHLTQKGYAVLRIPLHHFVVGKPSDGKVIDHINGNKTDNRRVNLREVTHFQNAQSCHHTRKKNALGLRGVFKSGRRFGARGCVNGKVIPCGVFNSPREAHAAYLRAMTDAGSMLPQVADDLDFTVLAEFPSSIPLRAKADPSLPAGITRSASGKFRASLRRDKKTYHMGTFKTVEKAVEAREAFLRKLT